MLVRSNFCCRFERDKFTPLNHSSLTPITSLATLLPYPQDTQAALKIYEDEALVINNNIEITVLDIKGDQVKIGITAPKEVPVYRKEVYLQIQNANEEANQIEGLDALKELF